MNRRTFMQAMAAAMSTPMLFTPRIQSKQLPDLSPFCDPHTFRYDLSTPWNVEGVTVATDARVLVMHPDDGSGDDNKDRKLPNLHTLDNLFDEFDGKGFKPIDRVTSYNCIPADDGFSRTCDECWGTGVAEPMKAKECPKCGGYGEQMTGFNKWHEANYGPCKQCHGTGSIGAPKCQKCDGKGEHYKQGGLHLIGGHKFSGAYVNKLRTLGDLDVKVFDYNDTNAPGHVGLFRWGDGGKALLMGVAT